MILPLLLLLAVPQSVTGSAKATGVCTVANTASNSNFKISCGVGEKQGREILEILNRILASKVDLNEINAKLDEILQQTDPNHAVKAYTPDGQVRSTRPGYVTMGDDPSQEVFKQFVQLQKAQDWISLLALAKAQFTARPTWITPYAFAAVADAHLGNRAECNQNAKYLIDEAGDNPDYASIKADVSKILTSRACN